MFGTFFGQDNPKADNLKISDAIFKNFTNSLLVFLSVLLLGVFWHVGSLVVATDLILPQPTVVLARVFEMGFGSDPEITGAFWAALRGSVYRAMTGFGIAFMAATVFGVLSGLSKTVQLFFYPWMQLLRATPVMSIILYLLLFVATDWVAIWVSFLIVFPIIYTNVIAGFMAVDTKLLEMARLYQVPFIKQLRHIYWPALFPYWMAACVTGMGLNVKAIITAEAMSLPANSFGSLMSEARNYLDTEGILAITLWIIILAIILDLGLLLLQWLVLKGRRTYVIKRRAT